MREAIPDLERIAFAWQPSTGRTQLDVALDAAQALGVEAMVLETVTTDDFAKSFALLTGPKRTVIILLTFPGLVTVSAKYAERPITRPSNDVISQRGGEEWDFDELRTEAGRLFPTGYSTCGSNTARR